MLELQKLIQWLQGNMLPCQYKQLFGIDCPLCGFQRSLISLLEGNIKESIIQYPAMLPLILTLWIFIVLYILKLRRRKLIIQWILLLDLSIMLLNCVIRNILNSY